MADVRYIKPGSLEEMLVEAAQAEDVDHVREILARGPDLDARLSTGSPIFFCNTTYGILMRILESGANVNAKTEGGTTLLHIWAGTHDIEAVQRLLDLGADVHAREDDGRTPIWGTTNQEDPEMVDLFIANGADVNARDVNDDTPLHTAVFFQNGIITEAFLRHGADVNAYDNNMATPLLRVNGQGIDRKGIADILLRYGADVNAEPNDGYRAIHMAAVMGDDALLRKLLDAGAIIDPVTRKGETPLDLAICVGYESTIQLLRDYYGRHFL